MSTCILGVSAYYHDSAACLLRDGEIVAAAQEERFTRKKHDARFPVQAVRYCLSAGGIALTELQAVAFYDKPLRAYPNNPAARKAIRAHAKCRKAR
jgi:carbamoyltransferase